MRRAIAVGVLVARDDLVESTPSLPAHRTTARRARIGPPRRRPVGDALAVGSAPAGHDARGARGTEELLDEARLAFARGAEHGEQHARPVLGGPCERAAKIVELAVAPDHRRAEPPWRLRGPGSTPVSR